MINFLKHMFAGKELEELDRWKWHWEMYRRWLSEFPEVAMTLDNMRTEIEGKESLDACHPPASQGPWCIESFREHLRRFKKTNEEKNPNGYEDWKKKEIAIAGLKSGDIGSIELAFQLVGIAPCPKCGYIKNHCKCEKEKING